MPKKIVERVFISVVSLGVVTVVLGLVMLVMPNFPVPWNFLFGIGITGITVGCIVLCVMASWGSNPLCK